MKYVDPGAILRVVCGEAGVSVPLTARDSVVSSELVAVETFRAPIDSNVIEKARASFSVPVQSLDAIHVATAEVIGAAAEGETVEFWTHDERQAIAALSRGITVFGLERG